MWAESRPRRILAYTEPTDMRKSFQGLLALVQAVFREQDPYAGTLFVFVNRRGNFIKALAWDRTGFVLYAKRLERGRFCFPSEATSQELSERAFRFLLDGIALGIRR
ncbi:MAG TPA: transposase [Alphaproteobacteria bacterium]|nr:transposase [Alphaproteobacteria bacterium]